MNKAVNSFKRAIKFEPDYLEDHYKLVLAFSYIREREDTLKQCQTLKKIDESITNELSILISK